MIIFENKEIAAYSIGKHAISEIRSGLLLIWQSIRTCFGSGAWLNEKPWGDEGWKN